jgi:hypothetical protein
MIRKYGFVLLAMMAASVGPARAVEATVAVPGTAMPWSLKTNQMVAFSKDDGTKPVEVKGIKIVPGIKVTITATGSTTTVAGGGSFGPKGQAEFVATDQPGGSGTDFPARYIHPDFYPVYLNELIGAFVDGKGALVARPFPVGDSFTVTVPPKAEKLQFGINDDIFADNGGALTVTVKAAD